MRRDRLQEAVTAYTMLLPDTIGLLAFVFLPIIYAFFVSLHSWNGLRPMVFHGFANYERLIQDSAFWQSLWTTVKYTLMYVPAIYILSLAFAVMVNGIRGFAQQVFRTLLFIPFSVSTVVAAIVWSFLYNPTRGYINAFLGLFGIPPQPFLAAMSQALPSVATVGVWIMIGYYMVIFLAAIKEIPRTYFEAAEIDGATPWQKLLHITIPSIRNTSLFVIVITTISSFQVFNQVQVMTRGGPAGATDVSVYFIYRQAFRVSSLGYASSIAFALFIIIMLLTLVQMRVLGSHRSE